MLAAVRLDFEPTTSVFGLSLRLETLAIAGVIFYVLLRSALRSGRSLYVFDVLIGSLATIAACSLFGVSILTYLAAIGAVNALILVVDLIEDPAEEEGSPKLRRDDLILIAFGAVPGAVVGGRLGYALIHFDYYWANPRAVTDPGQGGFDLTLAVVLGTLSAITVARLLAAPVSRWLGVASIPVLLGLGLGKLTMVLGGAGQGSYSDASWATSYVKPGQWGSLP